MSVPISVVVCAYTEDRWTDLRAACASVLTQLAAGDELIVVIDHNARLLDRTAAEVAGARVVASTGPPGLSGARNTGVRASRGDIVGFLDDDAVPRPGWLDRLRDAFADDRVCVVGSSVVPRWAGGRPPRWFPPEFGWVVGCGYTGLPAVRAAVRNPIGASMAIRRSMFAVVGGFSTEVGRIGTLPAGCEETEWCVRLARLYPDGTVLHEPAAAVDHAVPRHRQTARYLLRRCFQEGRSKWAVARLGGTAAGLSAERRYLMTVLPRGVLRGLVDTLRHADPFGVARSAVLLLGLAATVAGFASGPFVAHAPPMATMPPNTVPPTTVPSNTVPPATVPPTVSGRRA